MTVFPHPSEVTMQVWSKSSHRFKRYSASNRLRRCRCRHRCQRRCKRNLHQKQYVSFPFGWGDIIISPLRETALSKMCLLHTVNRGLLQKETICSLECKFSTVRLNIFQMLFFFFKKGYMGKANRHHKQ